METILKDGMCRCCASEGTFKDFTASYQWMGVEEVYSDMLKDCFDITLSTSLHGNSNGGICEVCVTQLRNAFNFKKQVQHTEEKFKKMQEIVFKPETIKIEMGHDDSEPNSDNMDDDFSGAEYDVPIKYETADDTKPKKRAAKASTSKKKPKTELGETSAKRNIESSVDFKIEKAEFKDTPTRNDVYKKTKRNISEILKCTNATPIRCRGGIGYMCCFCKEQYPNPADLKIHTLEHYANIEAFSNKILKTIMGIAEHRLCIKLDITALSCNICDINIDSLDDLFEHLIESHDRIIHRDIKNHIVPFKFETEDISCCICSKKFNSFKALLEHMNTHSTNYVCNICCATFVNKAKISVHELTHVISEFKCSYCPKVLDTKLKKACHESNAHKNVNKISKCGYCNEKFSSHKRKEMHLYEMHGVPLPKIDRVTCKICIREFLNKNALNAHLRRIHLLEKSHKCEFCDKEFFALNELNNHVVKHTGGRNFQCHLCLRAYKRKKTLTAHMHTHSDEIRFKCDLCELTYLQKSTWRTHMRTKHEIEV